MKELYYLLVFYQYHRKIQLHSTRKNVFNNKQSYTIIKNGNENYTFSSIVVYWKQVSKFEFKWGLNPMPIARNIEVP